MSCTRAVEFLEMTIGDTVDPADVGIADAVELRAHVAACAACARVRDEIRGGADVASRLYATDVAGDAALASNVRSALLPRPRLRTHPAKYIAAAAVLVGALVFAQDFYFTRHRRTSESVVADATPTTGPGFVPGYAGPHFLDVTATSGIEDVDHTGDANSKDWMVETVGHGACAFDMDGDGRLDLFVPDGNRVDASKHVRDGWRLYRNDGNMRFTDVTKGSGLECDAWAGGAVAGDVNGDGLPDLFVPCFGKNHLFLNKGGGKFEDVTEKAGVAGLDSEWSTAACMADFDGDGSLDIFVSNYADMRRFMSEASPRGCKWRDMQVACGPQPLEPQQNRLYLNRGDGTFVDATATNLPKVRRYSFQCIAFDANGDGAPDVFVATDAHPHLLLLNDGHGRFVDQAQSAGVARDGQGKETAGMGVAVGDFDGDGLADLFVTNFSHETNTLYRRRPGIGAVPVFVDVTAAAGLAEPDALLGWGASFFDFDCDGALDVMFANGHLYPGVETLVPTTSYRQPLSLYRNEGGARFREISASAGAAVVENRVHRGLVIADFDDDGREDAFVTVLNGRSLLLKNDGRGAGNFIQLSLRRKGGRVEAAGAEAVVTTRGAAGERRIVRELMLGSSFGSSEDPRLHFGLGDAARVEKIEVRWPFGATQTFGPLDAGHLYELVEGRDDAKRVR